MASMKTCPHGKDDRILLSGTKLRKMLSEGEAVTTKFSRQEVLDILRAYYAGLTEKVEIKLHKYAEGEKSSFLLDIKQKEFKGVSIIPLRIGRQRGWETSPLPA